MKILHIDETFHPEYGYHTAPLIKEQSKNNDVYIITVPIDKLYPVYKEFGDDNYEISTDEKFENEYDVKIYRVPIFGYISGRAIYKNKIFKVIKNINPDVIYCHLVESYIAIRLILKHTKYKIFFDSHMLSMASKNRFSKVFSFFYKKIITKKIIKKNYTVIRMQDDDYVNKVLGIPSTQTPYISFGTDIIQFSANENVKKNFREQQHIKESDFVVIYTGKLTESKGAIFFANAIKEKIDGNIIFIIVGNTVGEYGKEVERILASSENRIIRFPLQKYCNLPKYYQIADLCVFPKQCSLSFFDAQACELPVLSEDNNVNRDRIAHKNGMVFQSKSITDFRNKIREFLDMDKENFDEFKKNSRKFIEENYSYKKIADIYTELCEKIIGGI